LVRSRIRATLSILAAMCVFVARTESSAPTPANTITVSSIIAAIGNMICRRNGQRIYGNFLFREQAGRKRTSSRQISGVDALTAACGLARTFDHSVPSSRRAFACRLN
jgi:hypothetical protein